jgi:hypothetical protein
MRGKYRGLVVASMLLRVAAVVVVVLGVGLSLWALIGNAGDGLTTLGVVLGICISLLVGIITYSFGEVIGLLLDIRDEVRDKNFRKE